MNTKKFALKSCVLAAAIVSLTLTGATSANQAPEELVFSAPPRGKADSEQKTFGPVADYLSKKLGRKIVYKHIDNWLSYQSEMQKGKIDIVFDGPHFVSWRMAALRHEPVAKLPGKLAFAVIVKADDKEITEVTDLAGYPVCGFAPPNLATLTFLSQFENPARQPRLVNVTSFPQAYKQMLAGKCRGAVLRDAMYKKLDSKAKKARIIYQSKGIANQAFSAGPRLNAAEKSKIAQALVAPEAKAQISLFLDRYSKGKTLMPATQDEYRAHVRLLKDSWGFELQGADAAPDKPGSMGVRKVKFQAPAR